MPRRAVTVTGRRRLLAIAAVIYWGAARGQPDADRALSGGVDATVFDSRRTRSRSPCRSCRPPIAAFAARQQLFNRNWVTAAASTSGRDGLGPTFNAQSALVSLQGPRAATDARPRSRAGERGELPLIAGICTGAPSVACEQIRSQGPAASP
jgi:hypothetical protein